MKKGPYKIEYEGCFTMVVGPGVRLQTSADAAKFRCQMLNRAYHEGSKSRKK